MYPGAVTGITRQDLWRAAAFYSRKRLREGGWPAETLRMASVITALLRRDLDRDALIAALRAEPDDPAWQELAPVLEARLEGGVPAPTLEDMINDMREQSAEALELAARNLTAEPRIHALARFGGKAMVGSPLGPFVAIGGLFK